MYKHRHEPPRGRLKGARAARRHRVGALDWGMGEGRCGSCESPTDAFLGGLNPTLLTLRPMPDTAGLGDLWIRASRLQERCLMTVEVVALPPGWRVRIVSRRTPAVLSEGTGEHLIEAMAMAVNRAESMGLAPIADSDHRPVPPR